MPLRSRIATAAALLGIVALLGAFYNNSAPVAVAANFIFNPVADSYVSDANPTTNYGSTTTLRVDGQTPIQQSYLRFVVQNLTGPVTQATLRIYANSTLDKGYSVYPVADNTWGETTLTWSNQPTIGGTPIGGSGSVRTGDWTTINVTSFITGNGTYSLALKTTSVTGLSLASRQAGVNAPQLVVVTDTGSATSTPVPATPTATVVPCT